MLAHSVAFLRSLLGYATFSKLCSDVHLALLIAFIGDNDNASDVA